MYKLADNPVSILDSRNPVYSCDVAMHRYRRFDWLGEVSTMGNLRGEYYRGVAPHTTSQSAHSTLTQLLPNAAFLMQHLSFMNWKA
jgi:hypothetical protein